MLDKNKVEKFINAAMKYLGDKYSQPKRLQKGYSDCSSIIQKALNNLGWNTRPSVTVTTHRMGIEGDSRFKQIPLNSIERGDLVWWHKYASGKYQGHVGVYLGDKKVLEAIKKGVVIEPLSRLAWQKAYRIKALEETNVSIPIEQKKLKGKTTANLNVRSINSTKGSIIKTLKKGTAIDIIGVAENGWYKLKGGGFVSPVYVSIDKPKAEPKVIENVDILINGKNVKKGYIVNGITYITINGKDLPVRQLFENIGAKVEWKNDKVEIKL